MEARLFEKRDLVGYGAIIGGALLGASNVPEHFVVGATVMLGGTIYETINIVRSFREAGRFQKAINEWKAGQDGSTTAS